MRFPIRRSPFWIPALVPFGGTKARSFVELQGTRLHCVFGFLFDESIDYENLESVNPESTWPWYDGLGWRTDFKGRVAIVGSHGGVTKVTLKAEQKMRVVLRTRCKDLYVSLEDPEGFARALRERMAVSPAGDTTV